MLKKIKRHPELVSGSHKQVAHVHTAYLRVGC